MPPARPYISILRYRNQTIFFWPHHKYNRTLDSYSMHFSYTYINVAHLNGSLFLVRKPLIYCIILTHTDKVHVYPQYWFVFKIKMKSASYMFTPSLLPHVNSSCRHSVKETS